MHLGIQNGNITHLRWGGKSTSWTDTGLKIFFNANSCDWRQGPSKRTRGHQASNLQIKRQKLTMPIYKKGTSSGQQAKSTSRQGDKCEKFRDGHAKRQKSHS